MTWEQIVASVALVISLIVLINDCARIGMKKLLISIGAFLSRSWYWLLAISSSVFVIVNWKDCTNFEFFDDFNGENLIFVVWLVLLLLPLFDKLEIMGVNLKLNIQNKESEKAVREAISGQVPTLEDLETIKKEKEDQNV